MQNKPIIPNVIDEFANLRTYVRFSHDSGSLSCDSDHVGLGPALFCPLS